MLKSLENMIDVNWQYRGLQIIRLENELLSIDVLPELGAKIYNFTHRPSNRNLLWHNPRIPPARQTIGAKFDDVWSGGWDELIPNDIPTPVSGNEMLPDHGEIWSQPSEWQISSDRTSVRFVNYGHVLPTVFEKTISLRLGEAHFTVQYRLSNTGKDPIDFLWNIHPAMAISPATRLDVPACRGIVENWGTGHFEAGSEYDWPIAVNRSHQKVDMTRVLPAESNLADHHYLPQVSQGWYAGNRYPNEDWIWFSIPNKHLSQSMAIPYVRWLAWIIHFDPRSLKRIVIQPRTCKTDGTLWTLRSRSGNRS